MIHMQNDPAVIENALIKTQNSTKMIFAIIIQEYPNNFQLFIDIHVID